MIMREELEHPNCWIKLKRDYPDKFNQKSPSPDKKYVDPAWH